MLLAWENLSDDAAVSTDSEIATLPASNVQQPHVAQKWHTARGVKSAYLIFDMSALVTCDTLAVLGTNLTSAATVQVRASDSDPTVTSSLDYDSGVVSAAIDDVYGAIYLVLTSTNARYWRIDFADATVDDNLQIGRVFLGPSWTPTIDMQLGCAVMPDDPSIVSQSYGGQDWIDQRPQQRVMQFELDFMPEAEMTENAFEMMRAAGIADDVLAMKYTSGSYISQNAVWGRMQSAAPLVNDKVALFRQRFTIKERL